jgi:F-type H+-transporting ATPase subunit b
MQHATRLNRKISAAKNLHARRFVQAAGFFCVSILLAAGPAFAQEGGDSATDSAAGHTFRWLNFVIVFVVLAYLVVKFAAPGFRNRTAEIFQQIAEGARAREAAERQRQEIQAKVANLQSEIEELRKQARRDAEAEAQRLRDTGRSESEKIEQAAREEIDAAARAGRMELKALGARLSVQLAEAMLRQELNPQAEAKLFRSFVGELGRNLN